MCQILSVGVLNYLCFHVRHNVVRMFFKCQLVYKIYLFLVPKVFSYNEEVYCIGDFAHVSILAWRDLKRHVSEYV
jgi:hypothetical protein